MRYYVENVREALDAPGEWYLDRKTGVLLYWPREGEDMAKAEVVAPVLGELVRIVGERTADGYVFRTDLRLRPDPGAMPLAISQWWSSLYWKPAA